jgi:hypothetical protein
MKQFIAVTETLVTGLEVVTPHLAWLLRCAIMEHAGNDNVNVISFHNKIPKKVFGMAYPAVRGIAINLEEHVYAALDKCMKDKNRNVSLRALLLHELLDTAVHEADHLKSAAETGDWDNTELNEERAKAEAKKKSWRAAKEWEVDLTSFGPYLEAELETFMTALKEDAKTKTDMWRDLQIYMWDKNLGYYDPSTDLELGIPQTFEALAKDEEPWMKAPAKFISQLGPEVSARPVPPAPVQTPVVAPPPVPEEVIAPVVEEAYQDADSFMDYSDNPFDIKEYMPPAPVEAVSNPPELPAQVDGEFMTASKILEVAEKVFRTLFWHVQTKCEFTTDGGYNNSAAVLEPVRIDHIEGALKLFTHMCTYDQVGKVYENNQPTTHGIRGILTKEGLPSYKLFMRMNGTLHYRTLLPVNNNRVKDGAYTKWAQEARNGVRRMFICEEDKGKGIKAHITLPAGLPLGQEKFEIWGTKK